MSLANTALPLPLYTAEQCRELDRLAIEEHDIPGIILMKRAARATFQALLERWPEPRHIAVFCGAGNNAGDGYIVAALAAEQNISVQIIQVGDPAKLRGDAARAHEYARQNQVPMSPLAADTSLTRGVVVDAMLGTGARGAPRGQYADAVRLIRASGLPVLAVDIPTGLDADTGHAPGDCVKADLTTTFIGLKRGLFTGRAPALVGDIRFARLGVPDGVYATVPTPVVRVSADRLRPWLGPRAADAHKGKFGHVLVIGGERGTGGAALMAAESAGRVGAGLVSVATRAEHGASFLARRPELMVRGVDSAADLEPMLERASVLVVGPGLGQSEWSRRLLKAALHSNLPLVADADALNLISQNPELLCGECVLTPHPGEAARLLNCSVQDVEADRFAAVTRLQERLAGAVILKGAGSLIASRRDTGQRIAVVNAGNPGMASGGMGDVLSGVLGGLLAQGIPLGEAAEIGALIHGRAADLAARNGGERGLLATDLLPYLRELVNPHD